MHNPQQDYLTSEVLTASPEKLQLLLVEGALRQIHLTRVKWQAGDAVAASEHLIRCQQIVAEMIAGLDPQAPTELVKRIASVYLFVYRRLIEASFDRGETHLAEAQRVLEVERTTWRQLSQKGLAPPSAVPAPHHATSLGQSFVA